MRKTRRKHSADFKVKVVLDMLKEAETLFRTFRYFISSSSAFLSTVSIIVSWVWGLIQFLSFL